MPDNSTEHPSDDDATTAPVQPAADVTEGTSDATPTPAPDAAASPAPETSATTVYTALPYGGAPAPYAAPAPADPTDSAPRASRRRRGLLIGGVAAAAALVLGLSFGGGVAVGAHLGQESSRSAFEQGGMPGFGQDGERPEPPGGFGDQGGGRGMQDGDGTDTGSGSGSDEQDAPTS